MVIGLSFIIYHLSYSQVVAQSVEARIDSIEILMGEQAHVTLTVTAPEGATVSFPKYERTQQLTPGVEVIETRNEGDRVQVLTLTSFDENLYYLPPFAVLVNGDTVKSKSLALKVIGIDVDTTHFEKFYGPKDVQDNPFLWSEWAPLFWLSVLMLVLLALGFYLYLRLRDNKPIITYVRVVKKLLPHQKAMKEIEQIKADKMPTSENQKEYYTKLTDTIRRDIPLLITSGELDPVGGKPACPAVKAKPPAAVAALVE